MSIPKKRLAHIPGSFKAEKWIPRKSDSDVSPYGKTDNLLTLKQFDLNWQYGPCINITRIQRWNRASKLGLNPPKVIKELLTTHPNDPRYTECIWSQYNVLK